MQVSVVQQNKTRFLFTIEERNELMQTGVWAFLLTHLKPDEEIKVEEEDDSWFTQ